ncbi:MgtC/SapB family protein [Lysobacter korlensis]|uniref:Protein MgtC n=1 Tax=Lysobacter korlensis TaxID=553636 RepID=A0ABV6RTS5_9GAMM
MDWTQQLTIVFATGYAMLLGGVIGVERELRNRPAGFRTHMLVAGASSLLLGIGMLWVDDSRQATQTVRIASDPLRLIEAVIAGVAFIGAGTIFSHGRADNITGITTAASLLMVAVIGIAAGLNYFVLSFAATILTLAVLTVLRLLDRRLRDRAGLRREHDPEG